MTDQTALQHIVSQTRSNIDLLVSQNLLSQADAKEILAKLPSPQDLSSVVQQLALDSSEPTMLSPNPIVLARRGVSPPKQMVKVRALWNWNEDGQNPNDLPFRAGDVFVTIAETNPDWWIGRHNGKQGLFPSNYVEKIDLPPQLAEYPQLPLQDRKFPAPPYPPQYQPPMGPPVVYHPPPPNQQVAYNPYMGPPGNIVVAQPVPEQPQPPKKNRFGGLGNTLAQSAAGGVGFGAGSAVGSGIVNSLF
jgi:hypothetical protein